MERKKKDIIKVGTNGDITNVPTSTVIFNGHKKVKWSRDKCNFPKNMVF